MAVMNEDTRFEEAYREEGSGTNMCEYLDRIVARGEARGEARGMAHGEIKGTIATCREFGMNDEQILDKIIKQFQLEEKDALVYFERN